MTAALEDADQAIAVDPTYAAAYDTRAHIYEILNKRADAIADYRKSLLLDPHDSKAHYSFEGLQRLGGLR